MQEQKKRHSGFREEDQERIANKFQRVSDDRKGNRRAGLGFKRESEAVDEATKEEGGGGNKESNKGKKIEEIKSSIHAINSKREADEAERRRSINAIRGESSTSFAGLGRENPLCSSSKNGDIDVHHQQAIFSSSSSAAESSAPSSSSMLNATKQVGEKREVKGTSSDAPLYKRLRTKDLVYAHYSGDGKYHKAEILSIMHGGFHSAMYDIQYIGYDDKATLSWTELKEIRENDDEENRLRSPTKEVDAFGRSLSERSSQQATPASDVNSFNNIKSNSLEDTESFANSRASNKFLQDMLSSGTLDGSNKSQTSDPVVLPKNKSDRRWKDVVTYESPIASLQFSLDEVVSSSLLASRCKGGWKNVYSNNIKV